MRYASFSVLTSSLLLLSLLSLPMSARTIYVDDDGPADFVVIQAAIAAAQDGDIILVHPGVYEGPIDFAGKAVTVGSAGEAALIQAPDDVAVTFLRGEGSDSVLKNFIITSSYVGISVTRSSPTLTNLTIVNNEYGLDAYAGSAPDVSNCIFYNNAASDVFGTEARFSWVQREQPVDWTGGYSDGRVNIGRYTTTIPEPRYHLAGKIDEVAIFDRALSVEEVSLLCTQGVTSFISRPDPCFADPGYWDPNGTVEDANDDFWVDGDYHLKSRAGRWDPCQGEWVYDACTSPCVDGGNPACPLGDEPPGISNVRINMGAYGGTSEASKTPVRWALLADLNNDRVVDFSDLAVFVLGWLESGPCVQSDISRDDVVDSNDFALFGEDWLKRARLAEGGGEIEKPQLSEYYTPDTNSVVPNAPGYTLPLDLETIGNYDDMAYVFAMESIAPLIEQYGFAVVEDYEFPPAGGSPPPDMLEGVVMPYEGLRRMHAMLFITSDTLLHIYHVQFDETLKEVEENEFIPDIRDLLKVLLDSAVAQHNGLTGDLKEAAKRNVAYLAVANKLIDPNTDVPAFVASVVAAELAKIDAHTGFAPSNVFIYDEDYSQYVPRGHYTRSEELKRYFRTFMWLGRMAFLLKGSDNWGPPAYDALVSVYDAKIQTLQAVLLADSIWQVQVGERTGKQIWDRIYAVTAFYVGLADDLTPYEYIAVIDEMFGRDFDVEDLTDEHVLLELKTELSLLRSPKIYGGTGNVWLWPPYTADELEVLLDKTKGMRFMGQRFIPDSYMFQELVFPKVLYYTGDADPWPFTLAPTGDGSLSRGYPRGLDVMAILGSTQAESILSTQGDTDYVNYAAQYDALKQEFDAFDEGDWNCNLYWSWLYALRSLLSECPQGYPNFMRTDAWQRKQLNAALASWTELRHDTILYAKQSYTPVGKGGVSPPPNATGYVEPVPQFYRRLWSLANMTRTGLGALGALSEQGAQRLQSLENMLRRLAEIADKELANQELSDDDFEYIGDFAETLEEAVVGIEGEGVSTILVADVHTHSYEEKVVEEAVGYVDILIVACPLSNGSIILAAGPVLSYYEFKWPMSDRLTDEGWRSLLDSSDRPDRPKWYQPFVR